MPYVKPQLLCQDMPLTFQMVNVIQDNLYDGWLQFAKWHGTAEQTNFNQVGIFSLPPPGQRYGSHNDKRIPRAALLVKGLTVTAGVAGVAPVVGSGGDVGVIGPSQRQGVGVLDVTVYLTDYYAICTPFSDALASPQRLVVPTSLFGSQGVSPVLRLESYELVSGAFVRADYDFTAHIYGAP